MSITLPAFGSVCSSTVKHTHLGGIIRSLFIGTHFRETDPILRIEEFHFTENDGYHARNFTDIEEIIYLFDGSLKHTDDLGNCKMITSGDAQRIISGKGIHVTEKVPGNSNAHGICIWLNTCKADRNAIADYSAIRNSDLPVVENEMVTIRTICGEDSPLNVCGDILIRDIILQPGSTVSIECPNDHHGMIYLIGENTSDSTIESKTLRPGEAFQYHNREQLQISSGNKLSRFIMVSGKPVKEDLDMNESITAL